MNRQEFMKELEYLLRAIPENERIDALAYYNDYFEEAGAENEYQVIQELGSPQQVAQTILADYGSETTKTRQDYSSPEQESKDCYTYSQSSYEYQANEQSNPYGTQTSSSGAEPRKGMSKSTKILIIVLLILTFPLWIGVVAGLFGGVVGILGGLFGTVVGLGGAGIGLLVGGVACFVVGILRLFTLPIEGLVTTAVGAILIAIGLLLVLLISWILIMWLPKLIRAFVQWIRGLRKPQEGGDEI